MRDCDVDKLFLQASLQAPPTHLLTQPVALHSCQHAAPQKRAAWGPGMTERRDLVSSRTCTAPAHACSVRKDKLQRSLVN